jgi:hypothetical protein
MAVALLLIVTAGVAECASRLPFMAMASRFLEVFPRAVRTIRNNKVSDHWKERALLKLARLSLISSGCIAGTIFGLVALFLAGSYLLSLLSPPLWDLALSIKGMAVATVAAILYLAAKPRARSLLQRR